MPPSPIPAPLPPWAKFAMYVALTVITYRHELLQYVGAVSEGDADTNPDEWRQLRLKFEDIASPDPRDDAYITFDIVNITNGAIDDSWTDADYQQVETLFNTHYAATGAWWNTNRRLAEYQWYRRAFTPLPTSPLPPGGVDKPFMDGGPPVRVTPHVVPGTAVILPPQVSICVTERTAWPHHHGRVFHPGPPQTIVATSGRITTAGADALGSLYSTLYANLMTAEFFPVVAVTQLDKQPARVLLGTHEIWVDDSWDVIRRRHHESPTYVSKHPIP